MSPGVHALPAEFEHLNLGPRMAPHVGDHQQVRPPPMHGPGKLDPAFDTSLLRKEKETYEGYNFERIIPRQPNEKATWALVTKTRMPIGQNELRAMVDKQKRKGPSAAWNLLRSDEMKGFKRRQVDELISDRKAADPRFEHELVGLKLDQTSDRRGTRSTTAFQVILKRQLRKDLSNAGSAGLGPLHESHREVVDLTGGSQDPSEGSSQEFFAGSSPPRHFVPPPHHGFPDQHGFDHSPHHGFEHPLHPPPFVHHHPGPPMHEARHEVHHGSPSPHHGPHESMPHFEDPFVQHDPHQAQHIHHDPHQAQHMHHDPHQAQHIHHDPHQVHHPPPAPFAPHTSPHRQPHEGHKEKRKEAKDAKHNKEARDMKPKIHQEKAYRSEKKHRKAHSESDWDYFSESSSSSKAYTDRTPDTSYSSSSSRKEAKRHGGKDRRRSSHSHHDDHGSDRHEQVYRVHRRKPVVSPDRSRQNERPHYDVDDVVVIPGSTTTRMRRPYLAGSRTSGQRPERLVEHFEEAEVIPASSTRVHRPYLARSRTSAHRPERLVEHFERPAFQSRHMSYEDDRHHDVRGLTPPGRRGSVYGPPRPLAVDLYDHREQQDHLEMEEMRREILREERRKEELRESVARHLEREAEERRRRDRAVSRDILYDERPGRWSRGYDNDRFTY
ncbi:MAG: hypothetical protein Q9186_000214 [Xanthomendoza sp. 1 TL-2023]